MSVMSSLDSTSGGPRRQQEPGHHTLQDDGAQRERICPGGGRNVIPACNSHDTHTCIYMAQDHSNSPYAPRLLMSSSVQLVTGLTLHPRSA
uniref:Uncharacterized protein n=1 Tax=Timema poppense TaxID=170557 RepID=A0A7R9H6K0_TIMPO|nr:unnamed protein product [Timema poppensis]